MVVVVAGRAVCAGPFTNYFHSLFMTVLWPT